MRRIGQPPGELCDTTDCVYEARALATDGITWRAAAIADYWMVALQYQYIATIPGVRVPAVSYHEFPQFIDRRCAGPCRSIGWYPWGFGCGCRHVRACFRASCVGMRFGHVDDWLDQRQLSRSNRTNFPSRWPWSQLLRGLIPLNFVISSVHIRVIFYFHRKDYNFNSYHFQIPMGKV